MLLTEINLYDLVLLRQMQIERLRTFFAESLLLASIYVDQQNILIIDCADSWDAQSLLSEIEELCEYAWMILGIEILSVCLYQEEIYFINFHNLFRTKTQPTSGK